MYGNFDADSPMTIGKHMENTKVEVGFAGFYFCLYRERDRLFFDVLLTAKKFDAIIKRICKI